MFVCVCGKGYKFSTGLHKHQEKCVKGTNEVGLSVEVKNSETISSVSKNGDSSGIINDDPGGGCSDDGDDITKSAFFTFPLTQLKPTENFSKEDLELLERRKQARLKAIQQSRIEEKQRASDKKNNDIFAAKNLKYTLNNMASSCADNLDNQFQENVGNEEHNASINIKYVRTSSQTQQVIDAVSAAANEYCLSQGIGCNNSVINKSGGGGGSDAKNVVSASAASSASGTTVYNHPARTISIIEKESGEDEMDESDRIVTLEKMTYLVLALIQQNTKIQKENALLKAIISNIDPTKLE
jgi:hypothetical protein